MYDDVTDIINDILAYYDNTDTSTVHNLSARTARVLHYIQRAADELWFWRAWPFTIKTDTLTMVAGKDTLPTDFARVSYEGGLYDSQGKAWTETDMQSLLYMRARSIEQSSRYYAVDGTYVLIPNTGSTETFTLIYQKAAPTLTTGGQNGDPTGFPVTFGEALLLGAVIKLKEEEGDARQIWRVDYQRALSRVAGLYGMQTRARQMPVTVGGMW